MRGSARLNTDGSVRGRLKRLAGVSGALFIGALVLFHAVLFAQRLRDQTILEPGVALQWIGALGVLAFLWFLRCRRASLFKGRSGLAFWLLVLLLHLLPATPANLLEWEHTDLLIAIPTTWMMTVAVLLGAALSALLMALTARPELVTRRRRRRCSPAVDSGFHRHLYARPPPARIA